MNTDMMKVEMEAEACCVCGETNEELWSPEEHDAGAPAADPPLRAMLLHLNHSKTVPSGRLCARCICKAQEAYSFSTSLAAKGPPPLSEKIRALRHRLHELTQKIDVFIVVGGGAGGAYSEEDIIMVEKEALASATQADQERQEKGRSLRGEPCFQCTVCPLTFQRALEYRSHVEGHGSDALHSCWSCGLQFSSHRACLEHAAEHAASDLTCYLCHTTFQSEWEMRAHEAGCESRCPQCSEVFPSRAALRAHVTVHGTVCAACLRAFPSHAARAAHAHTHRTNQRLLCGYAGCILRFNTRSNLISHLRKCHGSGEELEPAPAPAAPPAQGAPPRAAPAPVPCNSCERTFGSVAAMKRHARVHLKADNKLHDQHEQIKYEEMEWGEAEAEGEGEGRVEYLEVETLEELEDSALH